MSVSATKSGGAVTLATGDLAFDINYTVGPFNNGVRINEARVGGVMVAEQCFTFLKLGHRPKAYWAGIYPDASTPENRHFGFWDPDRRAYGVRTVDGVDEAFVRGVFVCRNPTASIGNEVATFCNFEMTTEFVLRDGASWIDRTDSFECEDWYHTQELTHFWQMPDNEEDPDGYDPAGAEGLTKLTIEGGETIPSLSGPASLSQSTDRLVGNQSLRIQVPAGNAGAEVEWSTGVAWSQERFFSYRLKPLTASDRPEAIRWYIKDSSGGKQYVSPVVELLLDLELDSDKKGHTQTGIWRQSFWDLDGLARGNVTAWGFEVLTSDDLDFLFDDCWIYARQTFDETAVTDGPDLWTTMAAFPDGFVDENVGGSLTKDFQRLARLPFFVGHVEGDDGTGNWGVSAQVRYRDSVAIVRMVQSVEVEEKYYLSLGQDPGDNEVYEDDKGAYIITTRTRYLPHIGVRHNARILSGDLRQFRFDSRFAVASGASRGAVWSACEAAYQDFDVSPVASRTSADLPDIGPFHKTFQNKAVTKYEQARWLRDMYERLGDGRFCPDSEAGLIAIHRIFRNPYGWLMNDDPVNMVLDTKQDLLQLYIDVFRKNTGQPVIWESTAAIFESAKKDIPHYRPIHMAGNDDGTRDNRIFFIYTSDEGFTVLRKRNAEFYPFDASVYEDIQEDGRTYRLNYTYPAHLVNLATLFHRAGDPGWKHGTEEPTVGDLRYKSLEELVENYAIDGIAMAEDCIYYSRSFAPEDLYSFNYWRQNVRSPALPALAEFDRVDNSQPVSASNPYKADDPELWAWMAWLSKGYMAQIRDLLHSKGVLCIVDVNVDSTIGLQDKDARDADGNRIYDESLLLQQGADDPFPGTWNTRQFDLQGRRNGIDVVEILDACDMAYVWLYGAYGPWGAVDAEAYFREWANPKHLQGRYMLSPGLYPRASRVPSAPDMRTMMVREGQDGYSTVLPSGKVLGQFVDDYWTRLLEGFSAIEVPTFDAGTGVLSVQHNKGTYFPKAQGGVTVAAPAACNVYHYSRAHAQKAAYEPYGGEVLSIAAGDSLVVTGLKGKAPNTALIRSAFQKGYGPVHATLQWAMREAGIPDDRWADPEVIEPIQGYFRNRPGEIREVLTNLAGVFALTVAESDGQLRISAEGPPSIAPPKDATVDLSQQSVDLRDPTTGSSDPVKLDKIAYEDLGAVEDRISDPQMRLSERRLLETELPREYQITFIDPTKSYDTSSTYDRRLTVNSRHTRRVDVPIAMFTSQARRSAQKLLYRAWANRVHYEFATTRKYLELDPGDIIPLEVGENQQSKVQLTAVRADPKGLLQITAKSSAEDVFVSELAGDSVTYDPLIPDFADTILYVLDIPALRPTEIADEAVYLTVVRADDPWRGASVEQAVEQDGEYNLLAGFPIDAVGGQAVTALPDGPVSLWDEASTVEVELNAAAASLDSTSRGGVLQGLNIALIGNEIVGFTRATKVGAQTYELGGLLRGIRGTGIHTAGHVAGERFISLNQELVERTPHPFDERYYYRAASKNQDPNDATEIGVTSTAANLRPFAPVHVRGYHDSAGDWHLNWKRQSRIFHSWTSGAGVPLGEDLERYEVDILDPGNSDAVVRTLTVDDATSLTYPAADQAADFGAAQTVLKIRVYQISAAVGRGFPKEVTL